MPAILLYLLKVNVALVLFYLAYHLVLRRLTFYHLNRLFLVFGIVFSTVYPFIDLTRLFAEHQPIAQAYIVTIPAWALNTQPIAQTPTFDYWQLPVYLFWSGVLVMFIRFIVQFISLYKIHAASEPANYQGISFRKVKSISQAFSFWQTIYINPAKHKTEELESILRHELIHITGWHTLDVLLAELSTVFYWFNPGAWLMKKAMKENLEFIADQNVVNTGVDKKEYQYLLLKVVGATQPQIANQFNFPSLKRRIAMMNKMPTSKANRLRLLIALPLAVILLFAFRNAEPITEAIVNTSAEEAQPLAQTNNPDLPKELIAHLKKNPSIKTVRGKKIDGKNAVVISLRGGGTEVYYLTDGASRAELERKYGFPELPAPPPPAPAAPDAPQVAEDNIPYIFTLEDIPYYKNNLPPDYKAFLKRNPQVKQLGWKFENKIDYNLESIVIYMKNGKVETYNFNRKPRIPAVEAKYGQLPNLPAPPPPVGRNLPAPPVKETNTAVSSPTRGIRDSFKLNQTPGPTYYIDGVEASSEVLSKLDTKQIHSINVIKGEAAKEALGDKAYYGAISIVTEQNKNSGKVIDFNKKFIAAQTSQPSKKHIVTTEESTNNASTTAKTFSFIVTADNASQKLFDIGKEHFKQNGFDVEFKGVYSGKELIGVSINSRHKGKYEGTSSHYSLADLKERNYAIIVTANKETGEVVNKAVAIP